MFKELDALWHDYASKSPELRQPSLKRDLGIDGTWLITRFGKDLGPSPGPKIGAILTNLQEWYQDEGDQETEHYVERVERKLGKGLSARRVK